MRCLLVLMIMMSSSGQSIGETRQGTSEVQQSISVSELEERDGLQYRIISTIPYTGKVIGRFYDGRIRSEINYKNGKKDGKSTTWYENGRIRLECGYKEGKRHGQWIKRDANGQVQFQRRYKDGRRVN